ncbi:hypothetical protein [Aureimonas glaciei]|uniref:Uncharacterized protein n=1 Tax=Aureimonas glaciei TaxID=1776957 RepID=A0A917DI76_9HYPH|nr:hypothetical protein [Aureimonas glaciei]GGD42579.1 hypothetical protein GCM10011335_51600 [Aureimonas glaciei]
MQTHFAMRTVLAAAVYAADAAGATVDRLGFGTVTFALSIGAGGDTFTGTKRIDIVAEHSDDGTSFAPIPPEQLDGLIGDGAGVALSLRSAHAAATVHKVAYIGDKRYSRLSVDIVGTHAAGTPVAVLALLGQPQSLPAV